MDATPGDPPGNPPTGSATQLSDPVTVSFTRRADAGHHTEMLTWARAGLTMAERFDGFLGGGWVQPRAGSDEWHMLCRFDSPAHLAAWEVSPERQWWLGSAQGLAEVTRTERRTGIEGWFDAPLTQSVEVGSAPLAAPPRWKQAITIWSVFFPLNLLATVTVGHLLAPVNVVLRVFTLTVLLTPIMTYVLLPFVTARLKNWLHRPPRMS